MDLVHRLTYNGDGVALKMGRRHRAKDDFYFDGRGASLELLVASYGLQVTS
jgi:hypothetical protein